jgi:hypothetical protein
MIYAFKWTVLIHYVNDYHLIRCAGIFNIIGCCREELWKKDADTYCRWRGRQRVLRKMLILENEL